VKWATLQWRPRKLHLPGLDDEQGNARFPIVFDQQYLHRSPPSTSHPADVRPPLLEAKRCVQFFLLISEWQGYIENIQDNLMHESLMEWQRK
jgi:hypothetical protein